MKREEKHPPSARFKELGNPGISREDVRFGRSLQLAKVI